MMALNATRQIRSLLNSRSDPSKVIVIVREFLETTNCDVQGLSEELTLVCRDFPHDQHTFIACLFQMHTLLPSSGDGSIIQLWWDIVLRPALKNPDLPSAARSQAFAIVLHVLENDTSERMIHKFQVRLVDLWVHDLPNDREKYGVNADELRRLNFWGDNLQQLLLQFALRRPVPFLDSICEASPASDSSQLSILLFSLFAHPEFSTPSTVVEHPIFHSTLSKPQSCLLLVPLVESLAVHSSKKLKEEYLSKFIDILLLCLREDNPSANPRSFFTIMYYLFPCNTLNALDRDPDLVRYKIDNLIRTHALHPQLAWSSVEEELSTFDDPWRDHDMETISAESSAMDINIAQSTLLPPPPIHLEPQSNSIDFNDSCEDSPLVQALQSQINSMRLELSLVRWHQTHNRAHIARLFAQQAITRKSEHDWQSMYNEIRNLRAQKDEDDQTIRNTHEAYNQQRHHAKDWHDTLLAQNRQLRKLKKGSDQEKALLESEIKELKAAHEAKDIRLSKTLEQVQLLKIARTEVQHKIDRLRDYEKEREKNQELQLTWAGDFERFKRRKDEVDALRKRCHQMKMLQASQEEAYRDLKSSTSDESNKLATAEVQLKEAARKIESLTKNLNHSSNTVVSQNQTNQNLSDEVRNLQEKNRDLEDSLTEIRARLELVENRPGLVGKSSPISPFRAVNV